MEDDQLRELQPNQIIPYGGNRQVKVGAQLAAAFKPGDRLVVVDETGDLLHIPSSQWEIADSAVVSAQQAFMTMGAVSDEVVSDFFDLFAQRLADDEVFEAIHEANQADLAVAQSKGRSTTRLVLTSKMRAEMIAGLQMWRDRPAKGDETLAAYERQGWRLEQRRAGLGVVGFVFEGRPNVFADACGVLRSANTVVFRIGSDALGTAKGIVNHALNPALQKAGLPAGSVGLIDSASHAAGWALFANDGLALAVARGSGKAVSQLGAVARQSGTPVSLHGTGGAWMVAGQGCDLDRLQSVVVNSLDRKVCNTLNTCCVLEAKAAEQVPKVLAGLQEAANNLAAAPKLWVTPQASPYIDQSWFKTKITVSRAEGTSDECQAEEIGQDRLGHEWEWENSPEITLHVVDSLATAVEQFNSYSPRFVASLISEDDAEQDWFWRHVDAPFVGDGFTRWVDGQYAFDRPELGLSNWSAGRLFGRGGVLSGSDIYTVRSRVFQSDPTVRR